MSPEYCVCDLSLSTPRDNEIGPTSYSYEICVQENRGRFKTVHSDSVERELQPGRWMVDSFITLPELAKPGMYALSARFESRKGGFSLQSDFLVESRRASAGRR